METWLLPLHSIGADYANLEGINAISNNIHRSTKNLLVFWMYRPRNHAPPHFIWWRHSFCGVAKFSKDPVDLSSHVCQVSHIRNVYVANVKKSQWKTENRVLAGTWIAM